MRNVYPKKYYRDEGFVEYKLEINEEDLQEIIESYLLEKSISGELDFKFDEVEIVNNRPMNIWLYAKCRRYLDPDQPAEDQIDDAEVEVKGDYPDED